MLYITIAVGAAGAACWFVGLGFASDTCGPYREHDTTEFESVWKVECCCGLPDSLDVVSLFR